jgi:V8-like Glu-specific endopeptidase
MRDPLLLDTELEDLEAEEELLGPGAEYTTIDSPGSPGDDRFQIRARTTGHPTTLRYPMNTICMLNIRSRSGKSYLGSGTLITPQVVLTARHNIYRRKDEIVQVRVTPGADLTAGTVRLQRPADPPSILAPVMVGGRRMYRWHNTLDYGVIILPQAFRRPTRFMVLQPRSQLRTATLLTLAGYPCDKPRGTMWGHSRHLRLRNVTDTLLTYDIDTCPGHSGSPIWLRGNPLPGSREDIRLLLGVHFKGVDPANPTTRCANTGGPGGKCLPTGLPPTPVPGLNTGVRVTCQMIDTIWAWCRDAGVRPPVLSSVYKPRCRGGGPPPR